VPGAEHVGVWPFLAARPASASRDADRVGVDPDEDQASSSSALTLTEPVSMSCTGQCASTAACSWA
jgi:hypothetical protein